MIINLILTFPLLVTSFTPPAKFCETAKTKCVFEDHKLKHLFCDTGYMSPESDTGPKEKTKIQINDTVKESILKAHNRYRNALGCGDVKIKNALNEIFPKAAKMPALSWDDELQWSAEQLSVSCITEHDQCRITPNFTEVGQNIGSLSQSKPLSDVVENIIWDWFQQFVNTKVENVESLTFSRALTTFSDCVVEEMIAKKFNPKNYQNKDFIQIVLENATKVGCGLSSCLDNNGKNTYFLVCNYNAQRILKGRVYNAGKSGGSDCKERSKSFCCLCKTGEEKEGAGCDSFKEYQEPDFPSGG